MGLDTEQKPQPAETQIDETESGWDNEGQEADEADTAEGGEEAGAKQEDAQKPEGEDKPAEPAKAELKSESEDSEKKKLRDQRAIAIGEAETLRRMARRMEEEGFLDRDQIAAEIGKTRGEVDALIDRTSPPESGDKGFYEQQDAQFDTDVNNPVVAMAIRKLYGENEEDLKELTQAYVWAMKNDPEVVKRRNDVSADAFVYSVFEEGKQALDDYRDALANGGNARSLIKQNRELKAELEKLKAAPVSRETSVPEANNDNEETVLDPLAEREKRLRALRR